MSHCDLNIVSSRMLSPVYPSSRALAAPSRPARSARRTIKRPRRPHRPRQCCAGRGSVRSSSQQQSGERDRRDRRRRTDSPSFTCCRPPVSVALAGARGRLGRRLLRMGRLSLGGVFRQNGLSCEGGKFRHLHFVGCKMNSREETEMMRILQINFSHQNAKRRAAVTHM